MNSDFGSNSESSLPTHPVQTFPSSPPSLERPEESLQGIGDMDNTAHFKSEPPATQTDQASKPRLRRVASDETERPPSAQQLQRPEDEDDHEDDSDGIDSDPAETITDFDWDGLHQRYHNAMQDCHEQEAELAQEWESLMEYFRIWAEAGHDHETDRTFQRLQSRTAHVQHSEARLEHKRNHYTNVVKAFESALSLLKATHYGR